MGSTFVSLYFHVVFSTKNRAAQIKGELRSRLFAYVIGTANKKNVEVIAIGGTEDHLHILLRANTETSISAIVRDLKSNSSRWVRSEFPTFRSFGWQDGYGAFTVSKSMMEKVKQYVENQIQHHKKMSFQDELRALLKNHGIEFDERYL